MRWQRLSMLGLFSISLVLGQDTRGNILGYVTDSSGSPIDGAAVTIKNVDTNVVEALKTNKSGYYEAPLLIIAQLLGHHRSSRLQEGGARGARVGRRLSRRIGFQITNRLRA
jgi:hypothetical protein